MNCAHCGAELRAGRVYETEQATHREYRCPDCGRAGRRTEPVDGRAREFGQCFNPRLIADGGRCRA